MSIVYRSAVLFVRDMAVSRRFYEDLLGQTIEADFGPNVGYVGGLGLWQAEHAGQMIFGEAIRDTERLGRNNLELYFESEDLEAVAARLDAAGVSQVHPIHTQPWGQRALRVTDPDGHIIEVGEPMPAVIQRLLSEGRSVDEVVQQTGMPVEMVQALAGL